MTLARSAGEVPWDAIIVGGGIDGLAAAAYLARAQKRVLLLEANEAFGGRAENTFLANGRSAPVATENYSEVDSELIADFDLHRRGLKFVQRAMSFAVLRPDGRHLILPHDYFGARSAIRDVSALDAEAYGNYRAALFRTARRLRPIWTQARASREDGDGTSAARPEPLAGEDALFDLAAHSSANAYLQRWFENEAVKTALGFDATLAGATPDDSGSALFLLWRAAQEVSGLQGALGQIVGGPITLAEILTEAARAHGAILLPGARVANIDVKNGRTAGVTLETGTPIESACVLSSAGTRGTQSSLIAPDALPIGALRLQARRPRVASAKIVFALSGLPPFVGLSRRDLQGRFAIADRAETAAEAKAAALAGRLPDEFVLEITLPSIADAALSPQGVHAMSVRVPYVPARIEGGWDAAEDTLRKRVLMALEVYAPGLRNRVIDSVVITPKDLLGRYGTEAHEENFLRRFVTFYEERIRTVVDGLYVCGSDADPVGAVAGRAGRIAAELAIADMNKAGAPK